MEQNNSETISISEFLRYTLRHWVTSVIIIIAAIALAITYVQVIPAQYNATASITVVDSPKQQNVSRDIILGNYVALMTSNRVLSRVEESQHDLNMTQLRDNMTVTRDKSNEIITITYVSEHSDESASVIDSTIESFQDAVSEMYGVGEDSVSVLSAPVDSGKADNKSYLQPILVALGSGIVLALVVAFLRFDLEQRKKDSPDFMLKEASEEKIKQNEQKQKKIERDAEHIRKQKVDAELAVIKAGKTESEARITEAKDRIASIDLKITNREINKAKKGLEKVKTDRMIAEEKVEKMKAEISATELGLQNSLKKINLRKEKQIARLQSDERKRAARAVAKTNSDADMKIAQMRATSRVHIEKALIDRAISNANDNSNSNQFRPQNTTDVASVVPEKIPLNQNFQNREVNNQHATTVTQDEPKQDVIPNNLFNRS